MGESGLRRRKSVNEGVLDVTPPHAPTVYTRLLWAFAAVLVAIELARASMKLGPVPFLWWAIIFAAEMVVASFALRASRKQAGATILPVVVVTVGLIPVRTEPSIPQVVMALLLIGTIVVVLRSQLAPRTSPPTSWIAIWALLLLGFLYFVVPVVRSLLRV